MEIYTASLEKSLSSALKFGKFCLSLGCSYREMLLGSSKQHSFLSVRSLETSSESFSVISPQDLTV